MIEFDLLFESTCSNGIQDPQNSDPINIRRMFRHIKANLDMTHGSQVVDFGGSYICNNGDEIGRITKISIMQIEGNALLMSILVQVMNARRVEGRRSSNNSVNLKNEEKDTYCIRYCVNGRESIHIQVNTCVPTA